MTSQPPLHTSKSSIACSTVHATLPSVASSPGRRLLRVGLPLPGVLAASPVILEMEFQAALEDLEQLKRVEKSCDQLMHIPGGRKASLAVVPTHEARIEPHRLGLLRPGKSSPRERCILCKMLTHAPFFCQCGFVNI